MAYYCNPKLTAACELIGTPRGVIIVFTFHVQPRLVGTSKTPHPHTHPPPPRTTTRPSGANSPHGRMITHLPPAAASAPSPTPPPVRSKPCPNQSPLLPAHKQQVPINACCTHHHLQPPWTHQHPPGTHPTHSRINSRNNKEHPEVSRGLSRQCRQLGAGETCQSLSLLCITLACPLQGHCKGADLGPTKVEQMWDSVTYHKICIGGQPLWCRVAL